MNRGRVITVDQYLENIAVERVKEALRHLRSIIREVVPEAEETIAYGIPTYKFHGHLASFAAYKNHCSFFPGHTVADFQKELAGFKILKGTVRFEVDHPIPDVIIRQILESRAAENLACQNLLLDRNSEATR